jgi:hypothetical protein
MELINKSPKLYLISHSAQSVLIYNFSYNFLNITKASLLTRFRIYIVANAQYEIKPHHGQNYLKYQGINLTSINHGENTGENTGATKATSWFW